MQRRGRRSSQPRGAKLRSFVKSFNSLKEAIRVFQSLSVFKRALFPKLNEGFFRTGLCAKELRYVSK